MSQQRTDDTPRDWRRRRGRGRPGAGAADEPLAEAEALEEQSRTLFSFVEPVFDFVAVFYAPILIAGVVGLIAGAVLLGLNGIVVKSHGSADARGIANAVGVAASMIGQGFMADLKRSVERSLEAIETPGGGKA